MIKNKKGFTLVETMVALTIFAIVVTGVLWIYTNGYISYARNNQKIEVQENLRIALKKMSREIRQAEIVPTVSDNNLNVDIDNDGDKTNDNDKISFKIGTDTISYYYDGQGDIQRSVNGTGNNPIASSIKGLRFVYYGDSKIVTITVKGEKLNSGEISLSTEVRPRVL